MVFINRLCGMAGCHSLKPALGGITYSKEDIILGKDKSCKYSKYNKIHNILRRYNVPCHSILYAISDYSRYDYNKVLLHEYEVYSRPEIVINLISLGYDINECDSLGRNLAHIPGLYSNHILLKFYHNIGLDFLHRDGMGRTPFHTTISDDIISMHEVINLGYDIRDLPDYESNSRLQIVNMLRKIE